jgi:hypothetical protein
MHIKLCKQTHVVFCHFTYCLFFQLSAKMRRRSTTVASACSSKSLVIHSSRKTGETVCSKFNYASPPYLFVGKLFATYFPCKTNLWPQIETLEYSENFRYHNSNFMRQLHPSQCPFYLPKWDGSWMLLTRIHSCDDVECNFTQAVPFVTAGVSM